MKQQENEVQILDENAMCEFESDSENMMMCPKCGGPNNREDKMCRFCDYKLKSMDEWVQNDEEDSDALDEFRGRALVGGIIIAAGIAATVYGVYLNDDIEAVSKYMWEYGRTNPGTKWIVGGVIAMLVGVVVFAWRRIRYELTKHDGK